MCVTNKVKRDKKSQIVSNNSIAGQQWFKIFTVAAPSFLVVFKSFCTRRDKGTGPVGLSGFAEAVAPPS